MSQKQQPIIYNYLKKYQEDPTSRVFAPLAEAYRKAGMIQEAIEIAKEGLKVHPQFVGGKVALCRALFDHQAYQEVIDELTGVVRDVPDNLIAQRLLGDSYLILGKSADALNAYKMLLFFAPQDGETAQLVQELETKAYEDGALVLKNDPTPIPEFDVRPASAVLQQEPAMSLDQKIRRIEMLQGLLQKVERYRIVNQISQNKL